MPEASLLFIFFYIHKKRALCAWPAVVNLAGNIIHLWNYFKAWHIFMWVCQLFSNSLRWMKRSAIFLSLHSEVIQHCLCLYYNRSWVWLGGSAVRSSSALLNFPSYSAFGSKAGLLADKWSPAPLPHFECPVTILCSYAIKNCDAPFWS